MSPTRESIVQLSARRTFLLITLIKIVAVPCLSQPQAISVKRASLPDCSGSRS
jgi:hypothetical protein